MNNDSPRQERVLKIFTPVRCISRDQLLRYHRGNMTPVEQHLVEQHIIDCDLCHDALHAISNPQLHDRYNHFADELSQFIHREFAPPPKPDKRLQQRKINARKTSDSLLSYFWAIMFVAIGGGSIFLLQQHLKNRPVLAALPAPAPETLILPASNPPAAIDPDYQSDRPNTKPLVIHTQYNSTARDTINKTNTAALTAGIDANAKPVKKDSVSLKKKAPKDSISKPATDTATRFAAHPPKTEPQKQEPKEKALLTREEEPLHTKNTASATTADNNKTEAEKKPKEEPQPPTISGDESLFRTAMRYQQQGDLNEAANQFKKLSGNEKYSERAKYQLAIIYKTKGQNGKARRLFREIIKMEGNMKAMAQAGLKSLNN